MSGVRALVLAGLILLVSACGGADQGASGSIRFLVFGDPPEIRAYRTLISAFEKEVRDVDVQLVEASDREDLLTRLSTSFAGGSPPDLFLINYRFYGQFASKGVLEPLGERAGESDVLDLDGFYPQAVDAFRWEGELTCLPQNVSSLVVYYNRDLFERYAVPEPRSGWTWSEFVRAAQALTRDEAGAAVRGQDPDQPQTATPPKVAVYGVGVEPTIIRIAPFVWSIGEELVDDDERPTRFTLDSPAAKAALAEFFALRTQYGVAPSDVDVEAEDDESRFANGRLAMLLSSRRSTPTFRESARFDWDVAPLPVHRKPAGILHSDAYCMTTASKEKDAAWRFVEFALGAEGQRIVARTGRTVPSLRAVAESKAFLDPAKKPRRSRVFLDGIPTIRRVPTISTWPEIEDAAEGILENGMYLGRPVERVVAELDRATRPIFARAER
ncbi:MAG: sugar ABC transporter substrate-binding protein [Actinomycetota bacterium]|nr:sugar ABC transporter substrate-binding protein [Actinomycetota bacterium]